MDEVDHYNHDLNQQQNRAIDLMVQGKTNQEVADELDVDKHTVSRWKNNPIFTDELADRKNELLGHVYQVLIHLNERATDVMDVALENAYKYNENEKIVELSSTLMSIAERAFKITGIHGESMKELLDDLSSRTSGRDMTKEEEVILTELRSSEPEEVEKLGILLDSDSVRKKISKMELDDLQRLVEQVQAE